MEQLLHYVWKHRIFPLSPLRTTAGQSVEVIDTGLPNRDAGPDFFNVKLKIDGTLWVGNVEVHTRASDWMRHGHHCDKAYDTVILHVVGEADCEVYRTDGEAIPQLVLACPEEVRRGYEELRKAETLPPCYSILASLPKLTVHSWLSALQAERFGQKAQAIFRRLERSNCHWEDVFFITLARNFGFGLNGDAFEAWANSLPFRALDKHRNNLFQVESIFFGMAGLLQDGAPEEDAHYQRLRNEFGYLQHKFDLSVPMDADRWRFLRLRPGNFPHVRLAQLAGLYHSQESLFSRVMEAESVDAAKQLFLAPVSDYWEEHFVFGKSSPRRTKQVGAPTLQLIVINTVIPFLYAYGMHKSSDALCERATRFLEQLKAEDNRITRQWDGAGLPVHTAADSQALIQLQKEYCDKRKCLQCRFGFEYLSRANESPSSIPDNASIQGRYTLY